MTIIIGLKRNNEVLLCADRRISSGDLYSDSYGEEGFDSKLVVASNFVIGSSGSISIRNMMELFLQKEEILNFEIESKIDVIEFFLKFKKFVHKRLGLGSPDTNSPQELHGADWLVATRDKLFEINQDFAVMDTPKVALIGSGSYIGLGAISILLEEKPELDNVSLLEKTHRVVLKHQYNCGGSPQIINATNTFPISDLDESPEES